MKKSNASTIRKLGSVLLLAGITGTFLSVYYFIYLPKQRMQFNAQTFRILNNIENNFTERVANSGIVVLNNRISKLYDDVRFQTAANEEYFSNFDSAFRSRFNYGEKYKGCFGVQLRFLNDSIKYIISDSTASNGYTAIDSFERKPLSNILDPIIAIHRNTFSALYLIRQDEGSPGSTIQKGFTDEILFASQASGLSIANINTDSLLKDAYLQVPKAIDVRIDDINFKMFLFPFKIPQVSNETFVLAGLMDIDFYNQHIQNMPVFMLISVLLIIVLVLLALPFLKIFLLSSNESLHISDIRSIIAVIFILPFLLTLLVSSVWIYNQQDAESNRQLISLHDRITGSFYKEIDRCLQQENEYDSIIRNPCNFLYKRMRHRSLGIENSDLKNIIFHPTYYKNFTSMHWMNNQGKDIAVWNLGRAAATYFDVKDRNYYQDAKWGRGKVIPASVMTNPVRDSFAIQPILSRLTGEYAISIARKSSALFEKQRAVVIGITSKMYSVYNPVLPLGYSFFIVDSTGIIQCHSDTGRSLQENVYRESSNNHSLKTAINHKDSAIISDVDLYDQQVKMFIKPMPGLPYYLITYYQQRNQNLLVFHVTGFAFVTGVILLLMASLFSYFIMLSKKKIGKLSFVPHRLNWLKPSPKKKSYYLKNTLQLLTSFGLIILFSLPFSGDRFDLFWLNAAVLLPLFVVLGYYLIKNASVLAEKEGVENLLNRKYFLVFLRNSLNIYLLYLPFLIFYLLFQDRVFYYSHCKNVGMLKVAIWILAFLIPAIASIIAAADIKFRRSPHYLHCFLISLLIAVTLISVVPSLAIINFGFREERKLQIQSAQLDIARKIQQRRPRINSLQWLTKLNHRIPEDSAFIREMKFETANGIYLGYKDSLIPEPVYQERISSLISCSPFFKIITQFLFLPPDHDDFYDQFSHSDYYYWTAILDQGEKNSISLYFKNTSDNRNTESVQILTKIGRFYLFQKLADSRGGWMLLAIGVIFLVFFYKLLASATTRIFLLDYFRGNGSAEDADADWLVGKYRHYSGQKVMKLLGFKPEKKFSFIDLRKREKELMCTNDSAEEIILQVQLALQPVFDEIWKGLSPIEKYTLFDFSTDGFTNYKKMSILYGLYNKGLLVKEDEDDNLKTGNLSFMSMAFRNYLFGKNATNEIKEQANENKSGSWNSLRLVLIMVLVAFAVFIFITQQEATQRIVTILTSMGTLLPLMLKLFDTSSSGSAGQKKSG